MVDIIVDTSSDLDIAVRIKGPKGDTGDSAYLSWLSEGNTGTVQDFLNSLKSSATPLSNQTPSALSVTPVAGSSSSASRDDHTHKLPSAIDVGAEPAGRVASAILAHTLDADAHTQYAKGVDVSSSLSAVATQITGLQTFDADLSAVVDTKASSVSVTAVQTNVDTLTSVVNTKADSSTVSSVQANVDTLSTTVDTKASTASLTSTSNTLQSNIDSLTTVVGTKEPSISAGTTGQYWRGDKTWNTLDKGAVGLGNVDNTSDVNKPVSTTQQTALDLKTDKSTSLLSWAYASAFQLVSATRDINEAITTASIVWPDGITGTFTTDVASSSFPGAIDAWHATYVSSTTKTIRQTAVTRDAAGAVTAQPAITIT